MELAVDKASLPGRRGRPKQFEDLANLNDTTNKKNCSC